MKNTTHKSPRVRMGVEPENRKLSKYCIASFSQERSLFGVSLVYKRLPTPSYIHDNKKRTQKVTQIFMCKKLSKFLT